MGIFHVLFTVQNVLSYLKHHCGKENIFDVFSGWTAASSPGDCTHDSDITGCRIQGWWDRFGGAYTHSPERQENGTTTKSTSNLPQV